MFGVDQCRVCGAAIPVHRRAAEKEQEAANRRPPLPEAEWRRRGYLCPPTKRQLRTKPAEGCCMVCGQKEARRFYKPRTRLIARTALTFVFILSTIALMTYMNH
jgi:hypothetical protein